MPIATQNDIESWFTILRNMSSEIAGADMPPAEREKVKVLAEVGLRIAESMVTDLNLIGYYMGELFELENRRNGQT